MIKLDENWDMIENIPEETIVEFTYDILGRRIEKQTQEKTINYIYAWQNAIKEITIDNTTNQIIETRENIYSNNLDDILSITVIHASDEPTQDMANQYFYEKNHLGSITRITDIKWDIVEQYEYDVFWVAYASVNNVEAVTTAQENKTLNIKKANWSETADNGDTDELVINNIRYKRYNGKWKIWNTRLYTGREYDAELKLYYNRARYYNPDLGRFISRDPIDVRDDVNLYAYVGNNGVMFVDRSGLSKDLYLVLFSPEEHYKRNLLNTWLPNSEKEALENWWTLLNEYQTAYHNSNSPIFDFNKKYISKDWYKEIVFDYATWVKVVSDEDMWSYNYFNPNINPLEHFIYDTIPYFLYWNSYNDETTKADRILKTFNLVPAGINDWKDNIDSKIQITEDSINKFSPVDFINNFIIYAR